MRPPAPRKANLDIERVNGLSGRLDLQPIKCALGSMQGSKALCGRDRDNKCTRVTIRRATDWETEFAYAGQPIELGFVIVRVGQASVKEAYTSNVFNGGGDSDLESVDTAPGLSCP